MPENSLPENALPENTLPEKPSLDGLEAKWNQVWEETGVYRFDRTKPREQVYSIDTPPPTASGALHAGQVFSYTHTDLIARYKRMRGFSVFYPMGWDDNGLPTERRVQNHFGVGVGQISRREFVELCHRLIAEDEAAFERLWRRLGLSVDWSLLYTTVGAEARRVSQLAFLRNLARGEAYQAEAPTLWDVTFQTAVAQAELEDRELPGAYHRLRFHPGLEIETTRPELLPACVALVGHPSDTRYRHLYGSAARTPLFGVEVPILAHRLADPGKGTGLAMVCTFGDVTDVTWWRELDLPIRPVVGRDGRMLEAAGPALAGLTVKQARKRIVELLAGSGDLVGEPRRITHAVKFYEKGDQPLEIVTSRQWYIRNGGRDPELRAVLLRLGREPAWVPDFMRHRYEHWVEGLSGDWLISRQRYFGVPFPVWYRLDAAGDPDYSHPLLPREDQLPVDPSAQVPDGYREEDRGRPGGFIEDPDVMDTWATSALTPQIVCGWERDPDLFARTFPMDLNTHAHEIIRTWLFARVLRAHYEHGTLPWRRSMISGWVVDPDRKKMSKSAGNATTPVDVLERYGSDAVRWRAALARPGMDTPFDETQMKVGRRLAVKILNAGRFILGFGEPGGPVTEPLDLTMLAALAEVVRRATEAFESYDYTGALEVAERFFWTFCDDYLELVKERAYGGSASAIAALRLALSVQLRLFAPVMPYVTEEVWSWWRAGSIHRASWPAPDELPGEGDAALLAVAGAALSAVRGAKSTRRLSLRAEVDVVELRGDPAGLGLLAVAEADLAQAARAGKIVMIAGRAGDPLSARLP